MSPRVSVVLVNYKGADDTIAALEYLAQVDWPDVELIVVDNDSQDGSADRIRAACPTVTLVESGANLGFAGGCNLGVANATGEVIGFLNNDARPDRGWIRAAVDVLNSDTTIAAIASQVLDWDGAHVDFVDASLTWFGMGYKREVGAKATDEWNQPRDVLFATGAAMFIRTDVYRRIGGFDERYFMFYEDVDLGWRLNLLGLRVRYVPESIAYHRHHVTMRKFGNYREEFLLERNALFTLFKNYDDESLQRALPGALALALRRGFSRNADEGVPVGEGQIDVAKSALTGVFAVDQFVESLPDLRAERARIQATRIVPDSALFPLFRHALEPAYPAPSYLQAHEAIVTAFGIDQHFLSGSRVLVVTGEPLVDRMAGPAIRAWAIATALAAEHEVRLLSMSNRKPTLTSELFDVVGQFDHPRTDDVDWADIIVFQGFFLELEPWVVDTDKVIVADIYDPMHFEQLEQARDLGEDGRSRAITDTTTVLNNQLRRADYLLCASPKQVRLWTGQLAALGRHIPADPGKLIGIVPFGIPDWVPVQQRHRVKGAVPGISAQDKVILWGGGVYNWFDPLTLIRAVGKLARTRTNVRLYFMGMKHPNPDVPQMRMAWQARTLSDQLGLTGRHVFFNSDWVPYDERADVLLDADVGVSTHFPHVETEFSFRTRILDYLWAGLPIVATGGDEFGNAVEEFGLGRTVPPEDVDALVQALDEMLYDEAAAERARRSVRDHAARYRWSAVLAPLVEFCRSPHRTTGVTAVTAHRYEPPNPSLAGDLALLRNYWRAGGLSLIVRRVASRLRRVLRLYPDR